ADADLARVFRHYDVNPTRVSRELTKTLDQLRTGNARAPELSLEVFDLMRAAWELTSLEFNSFRIRSGYLLAALLTERALASRIKSSSAELAKIPAEKLQKEVKTLIAGSAEDEGEIGEPAFDGAAPGMPGAAGPGSKTPSLDQFTMNLTERARK